MSHLLASTGGLSSGDIVAWIILPAVLFLAGVVWGAVKLIIRMAQYFVRSEEAQKATATSTATMAEQLHSYMAHTDERFEKVDRRFETQGQQLAVLQWELDGRRNGRQTNVRPPAGEPG